MTFATLIFRATLIPIGHSLDIRGCGEMHPLNGPALSLFFEYIANLLYALVFRRFSKLLLSIFVVLTAGNLVYYLVWGGNGYLIDGWSLDGPQLYIGFTRVLFPFFGGMLIAVLTRLSELFI